MIPSQSAPSQSAPLSIEESLNVLADQARQGLRHRYEDCERRIRKSPIKAVIGAVAAGYCAHRLPVRSLVIANVRLLAALLPPTLVLFGAAKVYEFLQKQEPVNKRPTETGEGNTP